MILEEVFLAKISDIADLDVKDRTEIAGLSNIGATTVAFGKLGELLADRVEFLSENDRVSIFSTIEIGMEDGGSLRNYVATGLLEALWNRSFSRHSLRKLLDAEFGPRASAYLTTWDKFTETVYVPPSA